MASSLCSPSLVRHILLSGSTGTDLFEPDDLFSGGRESPLCANVFPLLLLPPFLQPEQVGQQAQRRLLNRGKVSV